jgi:hypothetical protein
MTAMVGSLLFCVVAAAGATTHWSTLRLDSSRSLRYAATPAPPGRKLVLKVTNLCTRATARTKQVLIGSGPFEVHAVRYPHARHRYVLTLTSNLAVLYQVQGTHLREVWTQSGLDADYVRGFPSGPTVFIGRHAHSYGLTKRLPAWQMVFEGWTLTRGMMRFERLAVRTGRSRYRLLPDSWGAMRYRKASIPVPNEGSASGKRAVLAARPASAEGLGIGTTR